MLSKRLHHAASWAGFALAVLGASALGQARAATDTDQFDVTATVIAACNVTAGDLDFGDYDPTLATPDDATSTIAVRCTNGTDYDIGLDEGGGAGATIAAREMDDGGSNVLLYALYQEPTHSDLWGDTINTDTVEDTGTGAIQNFTVYGRIPAQQAAEEGDYLDTVTVTVTFF